MGHDDRNGLLWRPVVPSRKATVRMTTQKLPAFMMPRQGLEALQHHTLQDKTDTATV